MASEKNEQVIYLKDLLFSVLYRWKGILATVIVFAVVFGAIKGISDFRRIRMATEETAANEQQLIEQYEAQKEALELKISALQDSIKNQKIYLEKSLYMALDPYAYYQGEISIYIDTDWKVMPEMTYQDPNLTSAVTAAYQKVLLGNDALQKIAEAVSTEPVYLLEVLGVQPDADGIMTVAVVAAEETQAEKMLDQVLEQVSANRPEICQSVAEHTVTVLERSCRLMQDLNIANDQGTATDRMTQFLADLSGAELALDTLQIPQLTADISVWKNAVKYAMIGSILGGFFAVVMLLVLALIDSRVYSARSVRSRTGIKVLCSVCMEQSKGVRRWLRKQEGRSFAGEEVQAAMVAAMLRNCYPDLTRLLLAGDVAEENRRGFAVALAQALPGVQVLDNGSVLEQIHAVQALANCDVVLMLVQCGVSHYYALDREAELIRDHGKHIAGCVVLNG